MKLTGIHLINFRNYERADITPCEGVSVLAGDNAQGKTNVLEAVYLCCTGRSHRTSREREMVRWGSEEARVKVEAQRADGAHDVAMTLYSGRRKQVRVGGKHISRSGELMGHVTGVLFSPEDLRLVKDGPEVRRRFMDMELSQIKPSYYYALQRYQRALLQRNKLLKLIAAKEAGGDTLEDWEGQLALSGATIVAARHRFIEKLCPVAHENHLAISAGKERLHSAYQSQLDIARESQIAEQLQRLLAKSRDHDLKRGSTHIGPHHDDIALMVNGQDVRAYGSQGQQRTTALSLKLSELHVMREDTGEWPVLMLDDVMSELDPQRRRMLLRNLEGVQVLVSLTDINDLCGARAGAVFEVSAGTIK